MRLRLRPADAVKRRIAVRDDEMAPGVATRISVLPGVHTELRVDDSELRAEHINVGVKRAVRVARRAAQGAIGVGVELRVPRSVVSVVRCEPRRIADAMTARED